MRAIAGVGAEKRESHGFVSRSCRLLRPIWHLHNQPLMRASGPFFITLASIEHTEPTVFTVCCRYVAGSLDVWILRLHEGNSFNQSSSRTPTLPSFVQNEFHFLLRSGWRKPPLFRSKCPFDSLLDGFSCVLPAFCTYRPYLVIHRS
jgi:hypothetical protein